MRDKPNTNKKEEQASKSNDEIRIANKNLANTIAKADKSIAEAQSFIDKTEKDIDDMVDFLANTCVECSARFGYLNGGMEAIEEELSEYFINTADIIKYKDHTSQICNAVLQQEVDISGSHSIAVSAFLNMIAKELNGTDVVEVTIDGNTNYSSLGILLNKGVKMYVDGSIWNGLARYLNGGEVKVTGDVYGSNAAADMKDGVLDIHGTAKGFHESAFASSNKGKIYLKHPTHGQVLIYDGAGITAGDFTKAATDLFDIEDRVVVYKITPKS